jgi:hypothetical protein
MRSLTVTFAKGLKKGRVQLERYHLHVLRSLIETRNAIQYVLFNKQKHEKGIYSTIDEYSSALSLIDAIRKFARKRRMTLKVERGEAWRGDLSRSYLIKKALILEDLQT